MTYLARSAPALLLAAGLAALLPACGGSSRLPSNGTPVASPSASAANPCTAALAAFPDVTTARAVSTPKTDGLGYDDRDPRDFGAPPTAVGCGQPRPPGRWRALGDIAVLNDDGSLIIGAHAFDLGAWPASTPMAAAATTQRTSGAFRSIPGRRLRLADDATSEESLTFLAFYGARRASAFVNSDGNLTFGAGDVASTRARSAGALRRRGAFCRRSQPRIGWRIFVSSAPTRSR